MCNADEHRPFSSFDSLNTANNSAIPFPQPLDYRDPTGKVLHEHRDLKRCVVERLVNSRHPLLQSEGQRIQACGAFLDVRRVASGVLRVIRHRCHSILCPICGPWERRVERHAIRAFIGQECEQGKFLIHLTFTLPHGVADRLDKLDAALTSGIERMRRAPMIRGLLHSFRAYFDYDYEDNGHHPHRHCIAELDPAFVAQHSSPLDACAVLKRILAGFLVRALRSSRKHRLERPFSNDSALTHLIHVRAIDSDAPENEAVQLAGYLVKVGVQDNWGKNNILKAPDYAIAEFLKWIYRPNGRKRRLVTGEPGTVWTTVLRRCRGYQDENKRATSDNPPAGRTNRTGRSKPQSLNSRLEKLASGKMYFDELVKVLSILRVGAEILLRDGCAEATRINAIVGAARRLVAQVISGFTPRPEGPIVLSLA